MSWQPLLNELVNKYDPKTSTHKINGVCEFAAIYGKDDGKLYASYPTGWKLTSYEH